MLLETSDKTSDFTKPHIKKGYYPGKLLKVELFADKDGNARVGKYGQQLIFEFEVWSKDADDNPVEILTYGEDKKNVVIPKFVYHMYKNTAKDNSWVEGDYRTAITPNSQATKVLESLGWKFSTDPVDPESFIGKFVELNIDDYKSGDGADAYTASTIKDISPLDAEPSEGGDNAEEIVKLEESIKNLDNLKASGDLTEEGYNDAIEQVQHDLKKLKA